MHLHKIKLVQFRVYAGASYQFSPGINLIVGPNALGKTSLLEAVYLLIAAKSFRTHRNAEMIAFGSNGFSIEGAFEKEGVNQSLRLYSNGKEKGAVYNSTKFVNWTPVVGLINGAVLTPDDAMLIKGPPQLRRQYLDTLISQSDPAYIHHLERYQRALDQRNALLRSMRTKTLDTWEMEMAHSAAYLISKRSDAVNSLSTLLKEIHYELSGEKESISLHYKNTICDGVGVPEADIKGMIQQELLKHRPRELEVGFTLVGPHKDDIDILIDRKDVRSYASEGQQRTCVGSLKLAEWHFLKNTVGEVPLMLIDDLGISLDESRQKRLLGMLEGLGQVFLTSTQAVGLGSHHSVKITPR
jgi:DNA replication and repair protein RecF